MAKKCKKLQEIKTMFKDIEIDLNRIEEASDLTEKIAPGSDIFDLCIKNRKDTLIERYINNYYSNN